MPKGAYTAKQERKADHIEKGYEKRGVQQERSRRARLAHGQQAGQGRQERRIGPQSRSRSAAAKKGWETRRRHGNG